MITFFDKQGKEIITCYCGTKVGDGYNGIGWMKFNEVESCQADGHELDMALECCTIPIKLPEKYRVVMFVGDQAKSIAANWK